jgi:DNA-binding NarL/FixJ family response regulator
VDGPFVDVAARHARALAHRDGALLAGVAEEFEELGAELLAAEAYRAAENAHRRGGRGGSASVAARRVNELLRRCGNPSSPALELPIPPGEELTGREREVALLAARGSTSPQIAASLYLSVRTVDTHLSRVYRKLMIEGRHQLRDALGVAEGPRSGHGT